MASLPTSRALKILHRLPIFTSNLSTNTAPSRTVNMTLQQSSLFSYQACMACHHHFDPIFCCCNGIYLLPAATWLLLHEDHNEHRSPNSSRTSSKSTISIQISAVRPPRLASLPVWKEVLSWVPAGVMACSAPKLTLAICGYVWRSPSSHFTAANIHHQQLA